MIENTPTPGCVVETPHGTHIVDHLDGDTVVCWREPSTSFPIEAVTVLDAEEGDFALIRQSIDDAATATVAAAFERRHNDWRADDGDGYVMDQTAHAARYPQGDPGWAGLDGFRTDAIPLTGGASMVEDTHHQLWVVSGPWVFCLGVAGSVPLDGATRDLIGPWRLVESGGPR